MFVIYLNLFSLSSSIIHQKVINTYMLLLPKFDNTEGQSHDCTFAVTARHLHADMFRRYGPIFAETTPGGAMVVSIAERTALEAVLRVPAKRPYRPPTEIVQVYRRSRPDRYASTGLVNE